MTEREIYICNIFCNISNKNMLFKIYKTLLQINKKGRQPNRKTCKCIWIGSLQREKYKLVCWNQGNVNRKKMRYTFSFIKHHKN